MKITGPGRRTVRFLFQSNRKVKVDYGEFKVYRRRSRVLGRKAYDVIAADSEPGPGRD